MKTVHKVTGTIVLSYVVLWVFWVTMAFLQRARLTPPKGVETFEAFVHAMPPPHRLAFVKDSGEDKLVWEGELAFWSLPSGPACYVFTSKGELLEWDVKTGDGESTTEILYSSYHSEALTIKQVREILPSP